MGFPFLGLSGPGSQPPQSKEQMPSVNSAKHFTLAGEPGTTSQGRSFVIIEGVLKIDFFAGGSEWKELRRFLSFHGKGPFLLLKFYNMQPSSIAAVS